MLPPVKTPWFIKQLYPSLLWNKAPDGSRIFVTFDDGPIPIVTPYVLNILKKHDAKATFFCIGDNVRKHPEIFEQVKNEGHSIGNHTFNHLRGWDTADKVYLDNFLEADNVIHSNLFRPPYGRIKRSQIKLLRQERPDLQIVMWDILSRDYDKNLDPETCLRQVLKYTRPGSIVLFHDSLKAFDRLECVLPRAMEEWSRRGWEFSGL